MPGNLPRHRTIAKLGLSRKAFYLITALLETPVPFALFAPFAVKNP